MISYRLDRPRLVPGLLLQVGTDVAEGVGQVTLPEYPETRIQWKRLTNQTSNQEKYN